MPLRQPLSSLSLETCLPPTPDLDNYGILGSDDELDEVDRATQRRRIEKLAEAYLQGNPLFILSASLRGPFERDWVNPWKKSRKQAVGPQHKSVRVHREEGTSEDVVIQETNSRKRRLFHDPQATRDSRSSVALPDLRNEVPMYNDDPITGFDDPFSMKTLPEKRGRKSVSAQTTPKTAIPWTIPSGLGAREHRSSPLIQNDDSWLKKDHVRISSRNIDPPTSPTTTVSTRYLETKGRAIKALSVRHRPEDYRVEPQISAKRPQMKDVRSPANSVPGSTTAVSCRSSPTHKSPRVRSQRISRPDMQNLVPEDSGQENSLHILSSSSHLPEFEYRRLRHHFPNEKEHSKSPSIAQVEKQAPKNLTVFQSAKSSDQQAPATRTVSFAHPSEHCPPEDSQDSHTLPNDSHITTKFSGSHLDHSRQTSNPNQENTSEKPPSAQVVPKDPALADYVTSLHSIAVPKSASEDDGDIVPDPQFSTQAAVLLAQRSFQNDLESPEHSPSGSRRIDRGSRTPSPNPSHSNNITPFYKLNTPDKTERKDQKKESRKSDFQMMSTQGMINAVTPFTFSTEKKTSRGVTSSLRRVSGNSKQRKTSLEGSSSPSSINWSPSPSNRICSERANVDPENSPHPLQHQSAKGYNSLVETQRSALPMTLTGTTPPTAQDGQGNIAGAGSFNLSQAIADAGSWLQQSFDFNKDLRQCSNSRAGPSSSADILRSGLNLDSPN